MRTIGIDAETKTPAAGGPTWPLAGRIRGGRIEWAVPSIEVEYAGYCERQASQLLQTVPREAVRPLYARAREWAQAEGLYRPADPMAALLAYCRVLLPLPPLAVWIADRRTYPVEHMLDQVSDPSCGERTSPRAIDARVVQRGDQEWRAGLDVFRDGDVWRGFISFNDRTKTRGASTRAYRTADIFREADPHAIRARFQELLPGTLEGFLRSVLP